MFQISEIKNTIIQGNAFDIIQEFPANCIDMVMTSPPYWGLRNYNIEPIIIGGEPDCQHNFIEYNYKLDNLRFKGYSKKSNSRNRFLKGKDSSYSSSYCEKCNAIKTTFGLEPSFQEYCKHLVIFFEGIKPLWLVKFDGNKNPSRVYGTKLFKIKN